MKKIFTIRSPREQQSHLWEGHRIEDEVAACSVRSIAPVFLRMLPREGEILEAGCGLGAWVLYLRERGYRVRGIDHNEDVIGRLKRRYPGLAVETGDIARLAVPDGSVAAYISLGVVEHFESGPGPVLAEAFRVLRPGGLLFLTVPANNLFRRLAAHPLRAFYLFLHGLRGRARHFAEYRYSPAEVSALVRNAGFTVLETGLDDFFERSRSLTLWSEFPFLRGAGAYALNGAGKMLAAALNAVSRRILSSGHLVVAHKP